MNGIFGLVVCGGESSRMGFDKSLLNYHGQAQRYFLYEMLQNITERVFISCNEYQSDSIPSEYEFITDLDAYKNSGPLAALLSAYFYYPGYSFLAVGCDYPFISEKDMSLLKITGLKSNSSVVYFNEIMQYYEPLLSFYHAKDMAMLPEYYKKGDYSINRFLKQVNAGKMMPSDPKILNSVDTYESYIKARNEIDGTEFYDL